MWGHRNSKILIVADTRPAPGLNPSFLHQPDIRLLQTTPGPEALECARDERPRLIIQDVSEPIDAALELTRALRSDPATGSIPVIAVARGDLEERVRRAGASAVLVKPVIQREYWDAVRRFVRLPKRRGLRQTVNLRFLYRDGDRVMQAFSRDLSMYGTFLKTDCILAQGTHIGVQFNIPGEAVPVECGAVVLRSMPYDPQGHQVAGFAVEFEGLGEGDLDRLDRFIKRHLRRTLFSLIIG
jgi:CheY-like chemotaxis protein